MVEEGDLDDKLEDKATNEVVDDVKKVAMEGVDKEKKQVAMKVANTNCLDDLIDNALLLLFLDTFLPQARIIQSKIDTFHRNAW